MGCSVATAEHPWARSQAVEPGGQKRSRSQAVEPGGQKRSASGAPIRGALHGYDAKCPRFGANKLRLDLNYGALWQVQGASGLRL